MQVTHRLHITLLALIQLRLEVVKLLTEVFYFRIERGDILTDSVDGTAFSFYLRIDYHQVLQTLLHILLVGLQALLLFLDLLLNLLTLVLQGLHAGRLLSSRRSRLLLTSGLFTLHSSLPRCSRAFRTSLCLWSQRKGQQ